MRKALLAGAALVAAASCSQENLPPMPERPTLAYCDQVPGTFGSQRAQQWNAECVRRSFHASLDKGEERYKAIYPNGKPEIKDADRSVDVIVDNLNRSIDQMEYENAVGRVGSALGACSSWRSLTDKMQCMDTMLH